MKLPTATRDFILRHKRVILLLVTGVVIISALAYVLIFRNQTLIYTYDAKTCDSRFVLLPKFMKTTGDRYTAVLKDEVKLGKFAIATRSACIVATASPLEKHVERVSILPFGLPVLKTTYQVQTPDHPSVRAELDGPVSSSAPLKLALNTDDKTFTYSLIADGKKSDCVNKKSTLECDMAVLDLRQGEKYAIKLARSFNGQKVDTPFTATITTLAPLQVTAASVGNDATIYDKPREITITTDKQIATVEASLQLQGDDPVEIPITTSFDGDIAKILLTDELPREKKFRLTAQIVAKDGATFNTPYELAFTTSGGPKVTGVNIGSSGYIPGTPVRIAFDQAIQVDTDVSKFVELQGVTGSFTVSGNEIVFTPQSLPRCATFSLKVKKGVVSEHALVGSQEWSFSSRARCYSISSIGQSVQGRAISAYYFGNGGRHIIYTGAIHGNELSSKYVMESWIAELDSRAGEIPGDVTLVVVPIANPDGTLIGARNNARAVNLNRNFPTVNWEKDIITGGGLKSGEGGTSAGSEPETQALIGLTQRLNPSLVVNFHSSGSLVNSNDAGNSIVKGRQYANLAGYSFIANADTTATFGFAMTGTYEDWLLERGTSSFLIELNTDYANHFMQNRTALWSTMR